MRFSRARKAERERVGNREVEGHFMISGAQTERDCDRGRERERARARP